MPSFQDANRVEFECAYVCVCLVVWFRGETQLRAVEEAELARAIAESVHSLGPLTSSAHASSYDEDLEMMRAIEMSLSRK